MRAMNEKDRIMEKQFVVLRMCRQDLVDNDILSRRSALKLTDTEMQYLASKLGELYLETDFYPTANDIIIDL